MLERALGFLTLSEARRMARSRGFHRGRTGLAAWAGGLGVWFQTFDFDGKFNPENLAGFVAWSGLWAILIGGPTLVLLGLRQLRTTGTLELLRAAGTAPRQAVLGVWLGQLAATLLLAAGGVGALSVTQLFGGLEVEMLARLAACLGLAAVSATALALPAAATVVRPREMWLAGLGLVALLHVAPGPLARAVPTLPNGAQGAEATLANGLHWLAERSAPAMLYRTLGVTATAPGRALAEFAALHLPLAALAYAFACWRLRHEQTPRAARGPVRPALEVGADDPSEWLHQNFPRWGKWPKFAAGAAALVVVGMLFADGGFGYSFMGAGMWAVLALTLFAAVPGGLALAESSVYAQLHVGTPTSAEELLRGVRGRAYRWIAFGAPLAVLVPAFLGMVADGNGGATRHYRHYDHAAMFWFVMIGTLGAWYMGFGFANLALRAGALAQTGGGAFARIAWSGMLWLLLGPILFYMLIGGVASLFFFPPLAFLLIPLSAWGMHLVFQRGRRDALKALQRRHYPTQPLLLDHG